MFVDHQASPGFLAVRGPSAAEVWRLAGLPPHLRPDRVTSHITEPRDVFLTWDRPVTRTPDGTQVVLLSRGVRRHEADVDPVTVAGLLTGRYVGLDEVLPTFAAAALLPDGEVVAATDVLGFRHLYLADGPGWWAVSSSAAVLARMLGLGLDRAAWGMQSLLGWQLKDRTVHAGVRKLEAGHLVRVTASGARVLRYADGTVAPPYRHPVEEAAEVLRTYTAAYLEDHPDAILQLTGGQDSRLLLSAIPRRVRSSVRTITLGVDGSPDATIAGQLSARYGMQHTVVGLGGLNRMTPEDAYADCVAAAGHLDCMADPIALASVSAAEALFPTGPRLSGLGGEVARGFYYIGRVRPLPVTRERAERLARWRMFANEAAAPGALDSGFVADNRAGAFADVHDVLANAGSDWFRATDELYLRQRMQRWAGITDTAVCFDRDVINPMLDDRFLSIAQGLAPSEKQGARFLSQVQVDLDAELASLPLDGRPAPRFYARPGVVGSARIAVSTGRKAVKKVGQRIRKETRPPSGGEVLAAKVVQHWRDEPTVLDPVRGLGILDDGWLDAVSTGRADADPSTVAFVVNLTCAVGQTS